MTDLPPYQCPACGGPIELHFRYTKMLNCPHCGSGLLLEDQAMKLSGVQSVMADYPSLLHLLQAFRYRREDFLPVGRARFEYGDNGGYWDEWWVLPYNGADEGRWLSVDEGDYALEMPAALPPKLKLGKVKIGQRLELLDENLLVTEIEKARCIAVEGELPELLQPGDSFHYVHLSGAKGRLVTLEVSADGLHCYEGRWLDPFEIELS